MCIYNIVLLVLFYSDDNSFVLHRTCLSDTSQEPPIVLVMLNRGCIYHLKLAGRTKEWLTMH